MWFFTGKSTGCVVVIGWQAAAISDQLVDFWDKISRCMWSVVIQFARQAQPVFSILMPI